MPSKSFFSKQLQSDKEYMFPSIFTIENLFVRLFHIGYYITFVPIVKIIIFALSLEISRTYSYQMRNMLSKVASLCILKSE